MMQYYGMRVVYILRGRKKPAGKRRLNYDETLSVNAATKTKIFEIAEDLDYQTKNQKKGKKKLSLLLINYYSLEDEVEDPYYLSVRVAIENVKENGLENLITVWQSDGFDKVHRQYDLIFCNILAKPLIRLAPELKVHLAPGGCAILSGFLAHQEHWVTQAYKKLGLCVIRRYPVKGWCTVVVQKDPL